MLQSFITHSLDYFFKNAKNMNITCITYTWVDCPPQGPSAELSNIDLR